MQWQTLKFRQMKLKNTLSIVNYRPEISHCYHFDWFTNRNTPLIDRLFLKDKFNKMHLILFKEPKCLEPLSLGRWLVVGMFGIDQKTKQMRVYFSPLFNFNITSLTVRKNGSKIPKLKWLSSDSLSYDQNWRLKWRKADLATGLQTSDDDKTMCAVVWLLF